MTGPDHRPTGPTLRVQTPPGRAAERRYVLDVIFREWLGLAWELEPADVGDTVIRLAGDEAGTTVAMPDLLFATPAGDWLTERSMPRRPSSRRSKPSWRSPKRGAT